MKTTNRIPLRLISVLMMAVMLVLNIVRVVQTRNVLGIITLVFLTVVYVYSQFRLGFKFLLVRSDGVIRNKQVFFIMECFALLLFLVLGADSLETGSMLSLIATLSGAIGFAFIGWDAASEKYPDEAKETED